MEHEELTATPLEELKKEYDILKQSGVLDPDSPNFDIDLFNSDVVLPAEAAEAIKDITAQMLEYMKTPEYKKHLENTDAVINYVKEHGFIKDDNGADHIKENYKAIIKNAPELATIIEQLPEFSEAASIEDIMKAGFDDDGRPINSAFFPLFENKNIKNLPALPKGNTIIKPIDKITKILFDTQLQRKKDPHFIPGQMSIDDALSMFEEIEPRNIRTGGNNQNICIYLSAGFDDKLPAHLSRELNAEEEEIHDVVATMIYEGRKYTTATEIYQRLNGKHKSPSSKDVKKIDDTMQKLRTCRITIDNKEEITAGYKYKEYIEVEDTLIHYRNARKKSVFNDAIKECYYEFIGDKLPIAFKFSIDRKQISFVTTEQWATPVRKSPLTNRLKRYLYRQITAINKKEISNKMLLKSIYEGCHAEKDKDKRRKIKNYIPDFLEHWKRTRLINDYIIGEKEIYINPTEEQKKGSL